MSLKMRSMASISRRFLGPHKRMGQRKAPPTSPHMAGRSFTFYSPHAPTPYVQTIHAYVNNGIEGHLQFNGHYYVCDDPSERYSHALPQKVVMHYSHNENEPYDVSGNTSYYREIENRLYLIKIHTRQIITNTDVTSEIEDEDGEKMNVCFFPTNEQIIYFSVIKNLSVDDGYTIQWDD